MRTSTMLAFLPCALALRAAIVATPTAQRHAPILMQQYNQKTRLAEEAAAPFAKARSFAWPLLFAGAGVATYFAGTSLLAEAAGLRPPADGTAVNLAIDLGAMGATGFGWRNENQARDARLARLAQGANIAALRAQVLGEGDATFVRLSDFRTGRGDARRVVMVVAEEAALSATMAEAATNAASIAAADLLAVPVLLQPGGNSKLASPLALLSESGLAGRVAHTAPPRSGRAARACSAPFLSNSEACEARTGPP